MVFTSAWSLRYFHFLSYCIYHYLLEVLLVHPGRLHVFTAKWNMFCPLLSHMTCSMYFWPAIRSHTEAVVWKLTAME